MADSLKFNRRISRGGRQDYAQKNNMVLLFGHPLELKISIELRVFKDISPKKLHCVKICITKIG